MQGRIVTAPDGTRWRVRRRWLDRPMPRPWRRWRRRGRRGDDGRVVGEWSAFAVPGWRRSRRALASLAGAIEATGPPSALPEADPLTVERPLRQP